MSDQPGSKVGSIGPFASDETGGRVDVPITAWSPVFGPVQARELPADVPASRSGASAPGAVAMGWVGPCAYQLADLAGLRPGSGSAPDGRLQGAAEAVLAARDMDPEGQAVTGGAHARGTDFNASPVARPLSPLTPPG